MERRSLICALIIQFLMQGERTLHHDLGNLIVFHGFDLGELGVLGAGLFLGPKWVRAKDAKDAKGWRVGGSLRPLSRRSLFSLKSSPPKWINRLRFKEPRIELGSGALREFQDSMRAQKPW